MSSGGQQVNAATPWGPASPYLTDIMGQAKNLYGQQAPNYANPSGNFGYGQATGAVGNAIGGTTPFGSMATGLADPTTAAIKSQLSGQPDYTAVKSSLDAANQQTWDSFNNQYIPQLNQSASFLGNPSGAIKDLNWATANIGKNMDLNAQQQYLGEYDQAQTRQANAAGLGANIAQGAGSQALQGANLYQSLAQMPNQSLADYASTVAGTGGKFGTSTQTEKAGAGGTAANIIGGLTAGAGLVNSLTGTPVSSGVPGAWNALTGGSGIGAGAGTAALGSQLGAATAAGEAGVAGDVAASNAAWLASQPAAAGLGSVGAGAGAEGAGLAGGSAGAAGGSAAGGSAAATPALGAALGGTLAVAGALAPALYGASTNPFNLNAKYYDGLKTQASSLLSQGVTPANTGEWTQVLAALQPQSGLTGKAPQEIQALTKQMQAAWDQSIMSRTGMTQAQIDQYKTPGGAAAAAAATRLADGGVGVFGRGGQTRAPIQRY